MAKNNGWTTISIAPLTGGLDCRSIPADIPPGWFRWKLNAQVTPEGQLGRRPGFGRAWGDLLYDSVGVLCTDPAAHCLTTDPNYHGTFYHNHDHHHVDGTREPITFLQEITWGDKTRQLFDGTESRLSVLNETTGAWTDVLTGIGSFGAYWTAAFLQDTVIFTNDVDNVYQYPQGGPAATIPELVNNVKLSAARIAIEYNGCVLLMNTVEDESDGLGSHRFASRVRWCDLNLPLSWNLNPGVSLAGFQDLDYGDEILSAGLLLGHVYIYTRRKIWRVDVSGDVDTAFNFQEVYSEPKNQTGCLAYPRSLVSTGSAHYYISRDGIYRYSPLIAAPVRDDWLHRASGVMFTKFDTKMDGVICNSPTGEYRPSTRELWWSWPSGTNLVNDWTLVAQIDHETADVVDHGFTCFVNYRRAQFSAVLCNEVQSFIGASGQDYCLKEIGNVYSREFVTLGLNGLGSEDPTVDLDDQLDVADYYTEGYYSLIRGLIPTGLFDREKIVRNVLIEDTTAVEADPVAMRLRIGSAYHLADANDESDRCAVLWKNAGTVVLECPELRTMTELAAQNLRPNLGHEWSVYEQGRYLFFELRIQSDNALGTAPQGGQSWWVKLDFDLMAMLK